MGQRTAQTSLPSRVAGRLAGISEEPTTSDAHPAVTAFQADLAVGFINLGWLLARQKHFAEGLTALDTGLAIRKKLVKADPKNAENTIQLGFIHTYRGGALVRSGQPSQAAADLRRAVELWAKVPTLDPETRLTGRGRWPCWPGWAGTRSSA